MYDEELAQQPGVFVSADQISSLAVVAVSGLIAEVGSPHISPISHHISSCSGVRRQLRSPHISPYLPQISPYLELQASAYGKALGANADLKLLNEILLRCQPPIRALSPQVAPHLPHTPPPVSPAGASRRFRRASSRSYLT